MKIRNQSNGTSRDALLFKNGAPEGGALVTSTKILDAWTCPSTCTNEKRNRTGVKGFKVLSAREKVLIDPSEPLLYFRVSDA